MAPWVADTHFRDNHCCPNSVTVATSNHYRGCKPREEKRTIFIIVFLSGLCSLAKFFFFKCEFASLKCTILYCIINLVFCSPLIWFLCKCLKSAQTYQVALNAFHKEILNNTDTKRAFILPRNSACWHISAWRKMFCLCSTSNILTCYCYFSFFYYCCAAHKEMNFCFKLVFE